MPGSIDFLRIVMVDALAGWPSLLACGEEPIDTRCCPNRFTETRALFERAIEIPTDRNCGELIGHYGTNGGWVVVPIDFRAHGKDERLPVESLYDNVVHWQLMLRDLAGK
jgi:hypothetical protein